MYDVIIIGAGMSGLICACYLARAGMKVLVVEQHNKPGGYCTSFKRQGFTFDAAAHSLGGFTYGNLGNIFQDIGLLKKVKFIKFDPSNTIITPDHKISFWNSMDKTISDCQEAFPSERKSIHNFFNSVVNQDSKALLGMKKASFKDLLESCFKDNKLISMLSFPLFGNSGLPPSRLSAFIGVKIFREFLLDGGYYAEDCIQKVPDALSEIIREYGGDLYFSSRVKKIQIRDNRVTGVVLAQGDFLPSKYVISNCDARQTFLELLAEAAIDKDFLEDIEKMEQSLSVFSVYLGIDKNYNILPGKGINLWMLHHYDLDNIYKTAKAGDVKKIESYLLHIAPSGKSINALMIAPFKNKDYWIKNKERLKDSFIKTVESDILTDLSRHIQYQDAATPYTFFRYTSNYHGAAFGWECTPSQIAITDFRKPPFLQGLYMTGHWTTNGLGIPGVAYIGHDTAKMILRKEKLLH